MPYGTIRQITKDHLLARAKDSGLMEVDLGIEPEWDEESNEPLPDNLYEIAVIYGGGLDESFYIQTDYEVNIADWVAEMLKQESEADADHADWSVIVSTVTLNDTSETHYRVSSDD